MLRFHTQTAGCSLTAQQPDVNIMRVAYQALSAILGGTQSLHTNSRDEALALPSEHSVLIALRTQQVVGYEIGVADTVDPLGGSFFLENLTTEIEQRANKYIEKIDALGGAPQAIEFMQKEIHSSAYRYQQDIESGRKTVIGVNKFLMDEPKPEGLLRVDPAVGERQSANLAKLRAGRDNARVRLLLDDLQKASGTNENLLPFIIAAVKEYATLGEICDVLREQFGEYKQQIVF
jgi:methylmalonyl-CoA mutase N-terminal domain/subunit